MTQQAQFADELDAIEDDIRVLRTLVDAAVEHHDAATAHALSEIIDDRKARLRRVMRDAYVVTERQEGGSHGLEHGAVH